MKNIDQYYMQQTLALAKRGMLSVSPNPMVGCIIVKNGMVVGEGWHKKAGGPHAEVYALRQAQYKAKDATAYVSLEPCCYTGKTGPCTQALIKAGIKRVVVATLDPNPMVAGKGVKELIENDIEVKIGVLEQQAQQLNKIFFHYQQQKLPYVFVKWAMSLDGETTVNKNDSKQISDSEAKIKTHQLRNICDAIIVGKNTLLDDNPQLDVRVGISDISNPIRVVVFSSLDEIDSSWNVLNQQIARSVFVCTSISEQAKQQLESLNLIYWVLPEKESKLCLKSLLQKLAEIGITSVLVEGGRKLLSNLITHNLVDEFVIYISPVLIVEHKSKQKLDWNVSKLGKDILINAKPQGER